MAPVRPNTLVMGLVVVETLWADHCVPFQPRNCPAVGAVVLNGRPSNPLTEMELGAPLMSPASVCQINAAPFVDSTELAFPETLGSVFPCKVHKFAEVHRCQFWPATAVVKTNEAPTGQVTGNCVPICDGNVELAPEKST